MVSKKSSLIIAAIVTIFSFITVAYVSCSKKGKNLNVCENVVCQNGGYCYVDTPAYIPVCVCPTGYEGTNCETQSVLKFLATWNMRQVDTGSDSATSIGRVYQYTVNLTATATPTTFFIGNLSNYYLYNDIICTVDSVPNTRHFFIDTISATHMLYDNYKLLYGYGDINSAGDTIRGTFAVMHLSPTTNWVHDTFTITMTHL